MEFVKVSTSQRNKKTNDKEVIGLNIAYCNVLMPGLCNLSYIPRADHDNVIIASPCHDLAVGFEFCTMSGKVEFC